MPTKNLSKQKSRPKSTAQVKYQKPQKIKHPGRLLWLGFGLSGVALLSATAGALLAVSLSTTPLMQSRLSDAEASIFSEGNLADSNLRLPKLTRPVNILVLGTKVLTSDLEEEQEGTTDPSYLETVNSVEGLSDVILLLRFNPDTNQLIPLSIPRDTRTLIEGYGYRKINDANRYGGPAMAAKTVSELLGDIQIDRYIRINVFGVEKLVDALGGVNLYVPHDMKYQDDSQHLYINLQQGQQHLNGEQALQFLRFRNDQLGDIGRIQRQQILLRALVDQNLNLNTLTRLPKLLSVVKDHIDTNLSLEEIGALAGFAAQISHSDVNMLMLPGDFSDPKQYQASYWMPNYQAIDTMMAQHFDYDQHSEDYQEVDPKALRVAIQDSTEDESAVDEFISNLGSKGYGNVYNSQGWTVPLQVTRIIAQNGDVASAQAIRDDLGFGEVVVESTGSLQSDITIQLGQDWLNVQAAEAQELQKEKPWNN
ncbi:MULTISPECIES: LCP family protein [Planktothricoides]|uniref:LCP family protein n=1 Tax=Planktothricoides TaxID=132607 RepID=UPI00092EBBB0